VLAASSERGVETAQYRLADSSAKNLPATAATCTHDFVGTLESVRGSAALTVLIFHSAKSLRHGQEDPLEKTLWALPLRNC
jgi:hypothetical protein